MLEPIWQMTREEGPVVALALHDGHEVREEIEGLLALSAPERLREEDPFTGSWSTVGDTSVVALRSRFEVDLNRPREKAVYLEPEDAWGLEVWIEEPPAAAVARSLAAYDAFYDEMERVLTDAVATHGGFVVLDLHSYNHRRDGVEAPPADPEGNPEVNLGTGSLDRERWGRLVERFMADLAAFDFRGRHLDVRENVRFQGGHFSRWVHERFPETGCCLAVEWKKFFMDEWSGEPDPPELAAVGRALEAAVPGLREELGAVVRPGPRIEASRETNGAFARKPGRPLSSAASRPAAALARNAAR